MRRTSLMLHFRGDERIKCSHDSHENEPDGYPVLSIDGNGVDLDLFPNLDGLRKLHEAIGVYLAEHDAPAAPPIPAEAATDDAESLPPGWRATDCGYEHVLGDWVDTTHASGRAIAKIAGDRTLGTFGSAREAMDALDANRRDLDDDTGEFDTRDIVAALDEAEVP